MGMVFAQRKGDIKVNYIVKTFNYDDSSIDFYRTPQSEWPKYRSVDEDLLSRVLAVESALTQLQNGLYPKNEFDGFNEKYNNLRQILSNLKKQIDLSVYMLEYDFYRAHPVKTREQIQKEKIAAHWAKEREKERVEKAWNDSVMTRNEITRKRNDSINLVSKKQQAHFDSITIKNYEEKIRREDSIYSKEQKNRAYASKKLAQQKESNAKQQRDEIIQKYRSQSQDIFNHKVKLGWTQEMCAYSWGNPSQVHKTTSVNIMREQWVYGTTKYLYFDNGILTTIQE